MRQLFALLRAVREQAPRRAQLVRRTLALIFHAAAGWTALWAVLLVIQGLLPAAQVYLTKVLVDTLVENLDTGDLMMSARALLWPALLFALVEVLTRVLSALNNWVNLAQSELVQDHVKSLIHTRAGSAPYHLFERSAFYDRLIQASGQAPASSLSLLQSIGSVVQSTITFVSFVGILVQYSFWLPIVLFLSTLPALGVLVSNSRLHHTWWERTTTDRRWADYFDQVLTLRFFAAEVRLYELGQYLHDRYANLRARLRKERLDLVAHQTRGLLAVSVLALLVVGATMAWMTWRVLRGLNRLGDLVLFYQTFSRGQSLMQSLLSGMNRIYTDTLFLDHLYTFLDGEEPPQPASSATLPERLREGITFDGVSFRYPESAAHVLDDFDLHIPAGKIVAVVGENGAGKSTLTKLICRFFDPDEGAIRLDGIDLRDLPVDELRRRISIMFQYPIPFNATAAQNIAVGEDEPDPEAVREAAVAAGADRFVERLPNGYNTLLGRGFPGAEDLSGGQWQRLGLARAFYRDAEIFILDEPTAFMDSWAENDWLRRFRQLVRGKTALLITHRFTTAMQADVIHVMINGQVVESGSHDELLELDGRYAASWFEQTTSRPPTPDVPTAPDVPPAPSAASSPANLSERG